MHYLMNAAICGCSHVLCPSRAEASLAANERQVTVLPQARAASGVLAARVPALCLTVSLCLPSPLSLQSPVVSVSTCHLPAAAVAVVVVVEGQRGHTS